MNTAPNIPDFQNRAVYAHIGQRLRELRLSTGSTQADVAKVINISPQQYQKYEDAQSRCSLPYLMALADHFRVHLTDIVPVDEKEDNSQEMSTTMETDADLLARLVSAFVKLSDSNEKLRLVQLVEAIIVAEKKTSID